MLAQFAPIAFLATTQPEQAKTFYSELLGLSLEEDTPFALVYRANGTMLRIQKVAAFTPAEHTVLGWQVENISAVMDQLQQRGVKLERYAGLPQDERGIWTTPDGNKIAWFTDPDKNILSLTELLAARASSRIAT